jgi:hypothetical protein
MSNTEKKYDEKWFWGVIELAQRDRAEPGNVGKLLGRGSRVF